MNEQFKDVLGRFLQRSHYSAGQISALTSIPRRTILNWTGGRVRKPQDWQKVLQVADALQLSEEEATELLQSAGHPSIAELRQETADTAAQTLLDPWPDNDGVPFQTIVDLPYFVGREDTLDELADLLKNGRYVTIYSLRGMGGVGKTVLAARLAYRLRKAFPDGVLWARLDTSDTMSILSAFASAYGVDVSQHHDLESRAATVRNLLADKRALIILDNAQTSEQIRPLLPPTTGETAVIITTRQDLAVADEMHRVSINPFNPEGRESLAVFSYFLGKRSLTRWYNELKTIADLLGHLPLAIAIAAGRLAAHTDVPAYLTQLQEADRRLDSLIREDRSVRLSFDLSFETLSAKQQHLFTALGTFGGEDFSTEAAAYVADFEESELYTLINHLVQVSLVQVGGNGRYALHPLIQTYARENLTDAQIEPRMIRYFVNYATQHKNAYDRIKLENNNLLTALKAAKKQQMLEEYLEGVRYLFRAWYHLGQTKTALPYLMQALEIAQAINNKQRQASILSSIGSAYATLGNPDQAKHYHKMGLQIAYQTEDIKWVNQALQNLGAIEAGYYAAYDKAIAYFSEALQTSHQLNNPYQTAALLTNLGNLSYELGEWHQAEQYYLEVLALLEKTGYENDTEYVRACINLANIQMMRGQYEEANTYATKALNCAKTFNYSELTAMALSISGGILSGQRKYNQANQLLNEALTLARKMNFKDVMIQILGYLGRVATQSENFAVAKTYLDEELTLSRSAQMVWMECAALINLGEWHLAMGNIAQAHDQFVQAFDIAKKLNLIEAKAYVLWGLARTNPDQAIQRAQEGLTLLEKLGHKEAAAVRDWLQSVKV